ncbi:uncharacterized protein LOC115980452 [Quercus lobata]|uniref:uncharacterized protein LOC115980452 n=1 Tax=Quercus lobata TaxID=97700 RepID=UPI001245B4B4|nr:uncharacterized protein LOC115980452 [Quercus lobata]
MSKALNQISKSPFTRRIERGKLPQCSTQPTFTIYNGKTDPVEHVSHFNQRIVVHSKSETLMCKVFPSSLGLVAMRVPRPLDSLLSMAMWEGETLKMYSDRYWEIFNEINRDFNDVAIRTFKLGLLAEHDLRKSLTKKLVKSVHRLMDRIDEYKQVEED